MTITRREALKIGIGTVGAMAALVGDGKDGARAAEQRPAGSEGTGGPVADPLAALAAGLASVGFELLVESEIRKPVAVPKGQAGRVSRLSSSTVEVTFPAGCRLTVEETARGARMGQYRVRVVECTVKERFVILLRLKLANKTQPYFMIPCVLYGTNCSHRAAEPAPRCGFDAKLTYRGTAVHRAACAGPSWHFRADHSGTPMVIACYEGHILGLGIQEASLRDDGAWVYNSLGVWTHPQEGDSMTVALGTLDWPGRVITHQLGEQPVLEPLSADNAVGLTTDIFLMTGDASDRFAYEPLVSTWYERLHEPPRPGAPLDVAMRDIGDALVTAGIDPETGYFHMYRTPEGYRREACTLLAWAGVLQIARPLAQVGRLSNTPGYVKTAMEMTDRALREAYRPDLHLFYDCYTHGRGWTPNVWRSDLGHSSLINGHTAYLALKMYEEDTTRGSWAEMVRQVLAHAMRHQRADGRFPSGFSPKDGSPVSFEGYAGCFFVAPLLIAHRLFGLPKARDAALKAIEHYWKEFTNLEWVGVDLDCNGAVDSGSSYALSRALVEVHRQDGGQAVMDRLRHVLHYALSYHFSYNTRHRNPVCGWSSSGSKVTSTHNVHLDAYAGEFLEDILYYLEKEDTPYIRKRLEDSLAWARQAYNRTDAEYGWGAKGWVTEQYYHTYDHYHVPEGDGTVWVAYFPWTAGSLLNAFVSEYRRGRRG